MNKYTTLPSHILAFHSCDRETGLKVLNGKTKLKPSINNWDWLGHGIYFWEHNPMRALEYAKDVAAGKQKAKGKIKTPFVIGCIIDLGKCLNLTEPSHHPFIKSAYKTLHASYKESGRILPSNYGNARVLDCAVFKALHKMLELKSLPPYDTVRGAFPEGKPIYEGCAINDQTHIQICVRNPDSILGYFLPFPLKKVNPNL